jgi:hypothetical protein
MRKILDSAIDEVSEALSVHVAPLAIQIVVVPTGVTVLLGLRNPPRRWTSMVGPSLPSFTIAPCVDSLLCYMLIRWPKCILQDSPKIKGTYMHLFNCIWVVLLISRLNLAFLSPKLSRGIDIVLVYLCPCGLDNPRNTLRWKLLQLASIHLRIILFSLRTANIVTGVEEDGSAPVVEGEKERRPSNTDACVKELVRGATGIGGAGLRWRQRLLNEEDNEDELQRFMPLGLTSIEAHGRHCWDRENGMAVWTMVGPVLGRWAEKGWRRGLCRVIWTGPQRPASLG